LELASYSKYSDATEPIIVGVIKHARSCNYFLSWKADPPLHFLSVRLWANCLLQYNYLCGFANAFYGVLTTPFVPPNHYLTNSTDAAGFPSFFFYLTERKCRLERERQREREREEKKRKRTAKKKDAKQKGRCCLLSSPRQRRENLSFPSFCFLFYFLPSALNSSPTPVSLFPIMPFSNIAPPYLPSLVFLCAVHLSFFSMLLLLRPQNFLLPLNPSLCLALFIPNSSPPSLSLLCDSFPSPSPSFLPLLPLSPLPWSLLTANVCDEEMLLCQNGGTCNQGQKCICPPEFKGALCQQPRCEAGKDCNAASSLHLATATLLLCTLLAHLLATLNTH